IGVGGVGRERGGCSQGGREGKRWRDDSSLISHIALPVSYFHRHHHLPHMGSQTFTDTHPTHPPVRLTPTLSLSLFLSHTHSLIHTLSFSLILSISLFFFLMSCV